jgi:hypothetical protein
VGDYLHQTHYRQAGGVDHRPNARASHSGSSAAKELQIRVPAAQRFHQTGGIEIARCLSGRD